jgi:hypothetical protein
MKTRDFFLIFLAALTVSNACEQKEFRVVDARLKPYFERFQDEAILRGLELDFSEIEGRIEELEGVGGRCEHNSELPDVVKINFVFWEQANEVDREFIVFHELGHCVLNRTHLDTKKTDGTCRSIMHSGTSGCRNTYGPDTREAYLQELFYR